MSEGVAACARAPVPARVPFACRPPQIDETPRLRTARLTCYVSARDLTTSFFSSGRLLDSRPERKPAQLFRPWPPRSYARLWVSDADLPRVAVPSRLGDSQWRGGFGLPPASAPAGRRPRPCCGVFARTTFTVPADECRSAPTWRQAGARNTS